MSLNYETKHIPKACQLVGSYFWHWSSMELLLNNLIGKSLKLEPIAEAIICANLKLMDKIHIAKTTVSVAPFLDEAQRSRYLKSLEKIKQESAWRNMLAHNAFDPLNQEELVVEFLVTKAKGRLSHPRTRWSEETFSDKFYELIEIADALSEMIEKVAILPENSLANALLQFAPTSGMQSLGLPGLLSPSPEDHTSGTNSPTDPKDAQTPPSSPE